MRQGTKRISHAPPRHNIAQIDKVVRTASSSQHQLKLKCLLLADASVLLLYILPMLNAAPCWLSFFFLLLIFFFIIISYSLSVTAWVLMAATSFVACCTACCHGNVTVRQPTRIYIYIVDSV